MKTYPVPEEIIDLFREHYAAENCRNICAKSLFKAKRAIYYGKVALKARHKAYALLYKLYPFSEKTNWTIDFVDGVLKIPEEKAE